MYYLQMSALSPFFGSCTTLVLKAWTLMTLLVDSFLHGIAVHLHKIFHLCYTCPTVTLYIWSYIAMLKCMHVIRFLCTTVRQANTILMLDWRFNRTDNLLLTSSEIRWEIVHRISQQTCRIHKPHPLRFYFIHVYYTFTGGFFSSGQDWFHP
jgi:hypothetical protein